MNITARKDCSLREDYSKPVNYRCCISELLYARFFLPENAITFFSELDSIYILRSLLIA